MRDIAEFHDYLVTKGAAELTCRAYTADVAQFLQFADKPAHAVTREDIFQWDLTLALRHMDIKTRSRKHASLKKFFGFLERSRNLPNPAEGIETLKRTKSDPLILHPDELQQILHAQDEHKAIQARDGALIAFLAATGVRREELHMLNCGDVRPRQIRDKREIRFVWQAQVKSVKPRGRMRIVNFGNLSAEHDVASRHFGAWFILRVTDLGGYSAAAKFPLFPATEPVGKGIRRYKCTSRLSTQAINNRVKYAVRRTGNKLLDFVSPHTLRHFYATQCVAAGMDIKTLSHYLGHTSIGSTEHYVHLVEKMLATQATRFNPLANVAAKPSLAKLPMEAIARAAFMIFPTDRA